MTMVRLVAIAAIAVAAACGSSTNYGNPPPPPPPAPPPPPPEGHSTTIDVANNSFSPTPDTIPAGTITFHWVTGAISHNVTWQTGPGTLPTGSGNRVGGDPDYTATVQVGTYTYHCTNHAGMNGTLVVK